VPFGEIPVTAGKLFGTMLPLLDAPAYGHLAELRRRGAVASVTRVASRFVGPARSRGRNVVAVAVLAAVIGTPGVAAAIIQNYRHWHGHVRTTPSADCEYLSQTLWSGNPTPGQSGNPRIDTYASLDWGPNCSNTSARARPYDLSVRQDLTRWNGGATIPCNQGPWLNVGVWSHSVSTGYSWATPPCGPDYYQHLSYVYLWDGTSWVGNSHVTDWAYLSI
jgi:hypothetical protein